MGLFSSRYYKEGPGVEKDAPRKKGIARFFEVVGRDLNSLFLANVLTFVGFLPMICIVYLGFLAGSLPLLLAGAVLGLGAVLRTQARLNALQTAYDGTSATLTAEVEQVRTSFYPGVVDAVLRVETVDGEAAD